MVVMFEKMSSLKDLKPLNILSGASCNKTFQKVQQEELTTKEIMKADVLNGIVRMNGATM